MVIWLYRRKVANRDSGPLPFYMVSNDTNNSNNSSGYNDKVIPSAFDRQNSTTSRQSGRSGKSAHNGWVMTFKDRKRHGALEEPLPVQVHVDTMRVIERDGPSLSTKPSQLSPISSTTRTVKRQEAQEIGNGYGYPVPPDQIPRHKPHPLYWARSGLPLEPLSATDASSRTPMSSQLAIDGQLTLSPFGDAYGAGGASGVNSVYNGLASGEDVVDPYIVDFRSRQILNSTRSQSSWPVTGIAVTTDDVPGSPFGNKYAVKEPRVVEVNVYNGHISNDSQMMQFPSTADSLNPEFGDLLATKMDPALADILAKRMNRRAEFTITSLDPSGTDLPPEHQPPH